MKERINRLARGMLDMDVPQITGILLRLKEQGYDVDSSLYSVDEVAELILHMRNK